MFEICKSLFQIYENENCNETKWHWNDIKRLVIVNILIQGIVFKQEIVEFTENYEPLKAVYFLAKFQIDRLFGSKQAIVIPNN